MKNYARMKRFIIPAICVVLVAGIVFVFWFEKKQEDRKASQLEMLMIQARPYENEIRQIENELAKKKSEIYVDAEYTEYAIGFVPLSLGDLDTIKQLIEGTDISPVILLDCSLDQECLMNLSDSCKQENYQVIIADMVFDDATIATADFMKRYIQNSYSVDTVPFFLRNPVDSEVHRDLLIEHGFNQFVFYDESFEISELYQSYYPVVPYAMVTDSFFEAGYLSLINALHSKLLISFDFKDISEGTLSVDTIEGALKNISDYISEGTAQFATLDEMYQNIWDESKIVEERMQVYEKYEAEQKERIAELNEMIDEIYSHWDEN